MFYIQYYSDGKKKNLETIDEAKTSKEAYFLLNEYRLAFEDQGQFVYLSRRACKAWHN